MQLRKVWCLAIGARTAQSDQFSFIPDSQRISNHLIQYEWGILVTEQSRTSREVSLTELASM